MILILILITNILSIVEFGEVMAILARLALRTSLTFLNVFA